MASQEAGRAGDQRGHLLDCPVGVGARCAGARCVAACCFERARRLISARLRRDFEGAKFLRARQEIAIAGQRVNREAIPVQVVFQIKDAGEPRSREFIFVPGTVRVLLLNQMGDCARHGRIFYVVTRSTARAISVRARCFANAIAAGGLVFSPIILTETLIYSRRPANRSAPKPSGRAY